MATNKRNQLLQRHLVTSFDPYINARKRYDVNLSLMMHEDHNDRLNYCVSVFVDLSIDILGELRSYINVTCQVGLGKCKLSVF